jgi:hypothetical protein
MDERQCVVTGSETVKIVQESSNNDESKYWSTNLAKCRSMAQLAEKLIQV